ncbi:Cro/Cl family transcriptional regulator [Marinobacter maroccanus]|uniref:Cro/Cl family transcriptional regulator n=1 Tax=Marinobacter maroccanus TaxID=2055143 RepID=A0A2S5ZFK7_9GAMM|nr:YdaS family helix-turn-helix protein [Marinobacter maroccanus]PPI86185.1 Cro/Cl family transcriptional regulator [Marinobacter maroccanus]
MTDSVLEQLVECLGTKVEVARICSVRPPTLHNWTRIPAHHVLTLEAAVKAQGGDIDRYSMRPDIFGESPEATKQQSVA